MHQKYESLRPGAHALAALHDLSTGEALDILIRLSTLLDKGVEQSEIVSWLDGMRDSKKSLLDSR